MERDFVQLGRIVGLYGVRGWVKVYSYTDPPENILQLVPWYLRKQGQWREVDRFEGRRHGKGVIARIGDVTDRDQAAGLINIDIAIPRSRLPELPDEEFYWTDLEGLTVVTTTGVTLGVVSHLIETGANDVLVVRNPERERLVPYTDAVVRTVDLATGTLTVDWDPEF